MEQGSYRFEKAISGAYLGSLALVALKEILTLNLFSPNGSKIIDTWDSITMVEQLSMYLLVQIKITGICQNMMASF